MSGKLDEPERQFRLPVFAKMAARRYTVVAVLLALLLEVSSWWVSSSVTLQIEAGMTRSEVTQVLGKPHRIESHSDHELWLYNVWEAGDKFKIKFNSEEVVEWATF
jgi:hypothetical protein